MNERIVSLNIFQDSENILTILILTKILRMTAWPFVCQSPATNVFSRHSLNKLWNGVDDSRRRGSRHYKQWMGALKKFYENFKKWKSCKTPFKAPLYKTRG